MIIIRTNNNIIVVVATFNIEMSSKASPSPLLQMLLTVPAASCPARQIGKLRQTWQAPGCIISGALGVSKGSQKHFGTGPLRTSRVLQRIPYGLVLKGRWYWYGACYGLSGVS